MAYNLIDGLDNPRWGMGITYQSAGSTAAKTKSFTGINFVDFLKYDSSAALSDLHNSGYMPAEVEAFAQSVATLINATYGSSKVTATMEVI